MKKLLAVCMLLLAVFAGCNSSTGNDDNNNNGNTGNNTGNGGKYTVSGSVLLNTVNGTGISGATVVIAMVSQTPNPLMVTTGSNGAFSFGNIAPGNYLVSVTKTDFTFTPEFVSITVADKNVVVQTFVGTTVNTSGNAGSHSLFPLKTGAAWTFDSVNSVSGFSFNEKVIEKVTGAMVQGGKTYWAISSTTYDSDGKEDSRDTAYLRIENNVLYTYGTDFFTAKGAPGAFKAAQSPAALKALSAYGDLLLIKFNVSPGATWDIYRDSGSAQGTSYSVTITGKYTGAETVGAYSNCARYELDYGSETNSSFGKIAGRWTQTLWLAPNVGPVKTIEMFYTGDTLAAATLLSTRTNTLQTSQIP